MCTVFSSVATNICVGLIWPAPHSYEITDTDQIPNLFQNISQILALTHQDTPQRIRIQGLQLSTVLHHQKTSRQYRLRHTQSSIQA